MLEAAIVGCRRRIASIYDDLDDDKGTYNPNCPWMTDIEGAAAERALAKYMGVPWNGGVNTFKAPDVATFQVRSTTLGHGSLILRHRDKKPDEIYVLVIGECKRREPSDRPHGGKYIPIGWMTCREAKTPRWWRTDKNAWFVEQGALHDLTEIGIYERQG